jgi:hypothetical protein
MKEVFIIFIVLLVLLMLISTFGGSIRQTERYQEVPVNAIPTSYQPPMPPPPPPPPAPEIFPASDQMQTDIMASEPVPEIPSMAEMPPPPSYIPQVVPPPPPSVGGSNITGLNFAAPETPTVPQMPSDSTVEGFENLNIEAFDSDVSYAIFN